MAAYAALVSLLNNMEQIMAHPHFSTSFDKEQIESLLPRVDFLLEFIETHNSYGESDGKEEAKELEQQIASAAHAAEDVFEFYIVRLIRAAPVSLRLPAFFYEKIMEAMDSMKEKVMKAIENRGYRAELPESPMAAALSRPLNTGKSNMVGFDDYLTQLLEELTGYQSDRKIIPIVGMGGIGRVEGVVASSAIWDMSQLRHLKFKSLTLPDPSPNDAFVLHKLQTLGKVVNFKCSEEARKRIPNVKKLHVYYADFSMGAETWSYYSLQNFVFFNSLESLNIGFIQQPNRDDLLQSLIFPNSLKKLTLECCQLWWTDMTIFGSLPNLEALKIWNGVSGPSWDPVEGEFLRLKYLRIYFSDLICWNADNTHFPLLESLVLEKFYNLAEIPSGIGDIPTLERISLVDCSTPATLSAIRIVEEQESLGNESLQVKVDFQYKPNFEKFMEQVNLEGITGLKFRTKGA